MTRAQKVSGGVGLLFVLAAAAPVAKRPATAQRST